MGGEEVCVDFPVEQDCISEVLMHVKSQERESKGIHKLLGAHIQEIDKIKRGMMEFGGNSRVKARQ